MSDAPVHIWLPDQAASSLAGTFTLDAKVSRFHYDDRYREQGSPPLAPDMPVSKATHKIAGRDPIFPIMLEPGPTTGATCCSSAAWKETYRALTP